MNLKRYIPNFVTMLNLLSGCIAVIFAVNNNLATAAFFVFLGIFFDFFDGLLARKLNVQSAIGIQLDSLADLVTSGLVPGLVMFKLLTMATDKPEFSWATEEVSLFSDWSALQIPLVAIVGLLITLASAYRLAKFNVDEDQLDSFTGLPTPANALLILSLPLILEYQNSDIINAIILNKWFLIILTLASCYLLNCKLKLFALKFKDWTFKSNAMRYTFILLSIVALIILKFAAIPLIILLYIILSILNTVNS